MILHGVGTELESGSCHFYDLSELFKSTRVARSNAGPDMAFASNSALRFCDGHSRLDKIGSSTRRTATRPSETVENHLLA